jgi:hypothetical protein
MLATPQASGGQLHFQDWRLSADMQYVVLKTDHKKVSTVFTKTVHMRLMLKRCSYGDTHHTETMSALKYLIPLSISG